MQDHRRLRVWRMAHELAIRVHRATRAFPKRGYASLQSQTTRAAESIVLNIAEGCGTRTAKHFARYLDSAVQSSKEVEQGLELAKDYGVLGERQWRELTTEAIDVRRMLCGLRAKVLVGGTQDGERTNSRRPDVDPVNRPDDVRS